MPIIFSVHAKLQLSRRKIPRSRVLDTINSPDDLKVSFRGRQLYQKKFRDRILEVVVIDENRSLVIITAYYL